VNAAGQSNALSYEALLALAVAEAQAREPFAAGRFLSFVAGSIGCSPGAGPLGLPAAHLFIELGPFANHASVTVSHHEMHLHSIQHAGSRTIEGDMVLYGPIR